MSRTPGPSTPTNTTRVMAAATSQPRLRGTPSGTDSEASGVRRAHTTGYQTRSDVPPNDAATAENQDQVDAVRVEDTCRDVGESAHGVGQHAERLGTELSLLRPGAEELLQGRHQESGGQPEVQQRSGDAERAPPRQRWLQTTDHRGPVSDVPESREEQVAEGHEEVDRQQEPGERTGPAPGAGELLQRDPGRHGRREIRDAPPGRQPAPCRRGQALHRALEKKIAFSSTGLPPTRTQAPPCPRPS